MIFRKSDRWAILFTDATEEEAFKVLKLFTNAPFLLMACKSALEVLDDLDNPEHKLLKRKIKLLIKDTESVI
jgi:hypothetical protein